MTDGWVHKDTERRKWDHVGTSARGGVFCTVGGEHAQPTGQLTVGVQLTRSYLIRILVGGVHVGDGGTGAWPRVVSSRESVLCCVIARSTRQALGQTTRHRISHDAHAHARSYILSQPDMNASSFCATANRARHHR
jgi:hypothetical protein